MHTSRLGPFAIEEKLPGATCVYRAVHVEQQRSVALKVFSAPFGTGREARMDFTQEWELLKGLRHANIVRCFGGGMQEMQGFLASELVPGESLASLLKRRKQLSWDTVLDYALQAASGLEYAHEQSSVHEALAPEKLLITPEGNLKIADFRWERHKNAAFQSSKGMTVAQARYAAPEQWSNPPAPSPRSDMYALGCIMFEMLTGQPPFAADSVEQLGQAHAHQEPERVSRLALECPIWLDALVNHLLAKDPQKRPHSMAAVRLALEEARKKAQTGVSVAEHATSGISPLRTGADRKEAARVLGRKTKKQKRRSAEDDVPFYERAWFLAVCLALLAGAAVVLMWPPSAEDLLRDAEQVLAAAEPGAETHALRDYLEPLLRRFPESKEAERAQEIVDRINMAMAERQLRNKLKLGRELKNEGERLLAEAWEFEQFGDQYAALEKFESMIDLLPPDQEELRPYRNIARREAARLSSDEDLSAKRREFLTERLADADRLAAEGKFDEAERIWRSILSLYRASPELKAYVDEARQKLGASLEN